jgi:hypothetical protein
MYSKDSLENRRQRIILLQNSENNIEAQKIIWEKCSRDILYFFNMLLWTYDPRIEPFNLPFITYDFQDIFIKDIVEDIENGRDAIIEKSRDMGFTWMILGIILWGFMFRDWASLL